MKQKVIIDTDPGIDDALALVLATNSGVFDILAITTVCGNSTIENSTRNARYVLDVMDAHKIPIYQGAASPLSRPLEQATVHGNDGLLGLNTLGTVKSNGDAVEKIIDSVKRYPNEVTIIALGPLTNIARAIQQKPSIMRRAQSIVIMGGAVNVGGNMSSGAEFNFYVDPEAAKVVCGFPVSKALIPLDVCNKAVITPSDLKNIKYSPNWAFLHQMIEPYAENIYKDTGIKGAVMYDPLAVYYAIDQDKFEVGHMDISVGVGENDRGVVRTQGARPDVDPTRVATRFVAGFSFADAFVKLLSKS